MKRFFYYLILIPVCVVMVAFALANLQRVTVSLDPFSGGDPSLALPTMPLFLALFFMLIVGVLLGGVTVWFKQGRHRRSARIARYEAERYKSELERVRGQTGAAVATDTQAVLPSPVPF
jgi:uncharacterized integral membrane protein